MKPRINTGQHFTTLVIALFCLATLAHAAPEWQIQQQALNGTVFVETKNISQTNIGHASGFFVAPYRIVVPYHVIVGAHSAEGRNAADGHWFEIAGVTAVDSARNLAILQVSIHGNPLSLGNSDDVGPGQDIYVSSYSSGRKSFTKGKVVDRKGYDVCDEIGFSLVAEIESRSDGTPILSVKNKVVGIFLRGILKWEESHEVFDVAIHSNYLKALLDSQWGKAFQQLSLFRAELDLCALLSKANMKYEKGEYTAAKEIYDEVIRRNPKSFIAYFNRGKMQQLLGNKGPAKADFEKGMELARATKRFKAGKFFKSLGKILRALL